MLLNYRPARQSVCQLLRAFSFVIAVALTGFGVNSYADSDASITIVPKTEKQIEKMVRKQIRSMTVEEKVGQMTQVNIGVLIDNKVKGRVAFDEDKMSEAFDKYKVGSVLNSISRALTLSEWHGVINAVQDKALSSEQAIPVLYGVDAIHGVTYTQGSTLFPHNIGLAASRDLTLVKQATKATAMEVRATGVRWNFDPVLDAGRNPLWSRFEETFGEDVVLTSEMGVATVKGYEEDGLENITAVASCMKHFVGYSDPANGKDRTPAYIPNVELWEHYIPQFKAAIEAGSSTIMINSASLNGMPVHANKYLLTDVLRNQLGFKGLILSDWEDVIRLHTRHNIAETPEEAVRLAIEAGLDMSMVPHDFSFAEILVKLVKEGTITEKRIDKSVAIILTLKHRLGLFDNAYPEPAAFANFGKPEYQQLALDAAIDSITLLKNTNNLLPLPAKSKILLAGPAARNLGALHGSWSYSWQGDQERNYPDTTQSLADALSEQFGNALTVMAFPKFSDARNYDAEKLKQLAKKADYIVLALGEPAYAESPGALDDLRLPLNQIQLAQAAHATGKPVVLVLTEGRPRVVADIVEESGAIMQAYRPGSKGARAIAGVLTGEFNPSGVLPYSYPQYTGDITPYDRRVLTNVQQLTPGKITRNGYKPQWPFGYGLSYSTFAYSDLSLSQSTMKKNESVRVSVTVKNTSDRDGKHAVELYVSDLYASLSPSAKRLKKFTKVFLRAGEQKVVYFDLGKQDLEFVDASLKRVVEPGDFKIQVGGLKTELEFL